jgi:quinol monooxygenase YgiN
MIYLYLRHTVKDYALWREGFDNHAIAREASGATGESYVMRNIEDPNDITLILGWTDLAKAKAFTQSVSLSAAMQKAVVVDSPEIRFLEAANA